MKLAAEMTVEMTVGAKPCGFRPHLGNRCAIPTFPPPRRLLDCFLNSTPERSFPRPPAQPSFRLILRLEKTPTASFFSESFHQSLAGVGTQVVHDQMDGIGLRITGGNPQQVICTLPQPAR